MDILFFPTVVFSAIAVVAIFVFSLQRLGEKEGSLWNWSRRIKKGLFGLIALATVSALILNFMFFEQSLRWLLVRVEQGPAAAKISFEHATGNFLTGHIALQGATLERKAHHLSVFDLQAERLEVDMNFWSLLAGGDPSLSRVAIDGLRGELNVIAQLDPFAKKGHAEIENLLAQNVNIHFASLAQPNLPLDFPLEVEQVHVQNFRTRWVTLDLLFHSNGNGKVAGGAFELSTGSQEAGIKSVWHVEQLPANLVDTNIVSLLNQVADRKFNLHVESNWQPANDIDDIAMHWQVAFAEDEPSTDQTNSIASTNQSVTNNGQPVLNFLTQLLAPGDSEWPLEFDFVLKRSALQGDTKALNDEVGRVASVIATKTAANMLGGSKVDLGALGKNLFKGLQNFRKQNQERRKKQPQRKNQPQPPQGDVPR